MATTIYIPLALLTVQPDSANVFWTATNNTNQDQGFVRYVDSGEGISTWYGIVPSNVADTEAWGLTYYSVANTLGAGNVMLTTRGRVVQNGQDMDAAYVMLSSAAAISMFMADTLSIIAASGGTFDAALALVSTAWVYVEVNRHGGNAADTLSAAWDLYGVAMRVDIS